MKSLYTIAFVFLAANLAACQTTGTKDANQFGRWQLTAGYKGDTPRGGTTIGTPVTYDKTPNTYWQKLAKATTTKEKDRLAILAMTGGYQVTFEFQETIGFEAGYGLDRPYRSWATEKIYVVKNEADFISLQHILVMYFKTGGKVKGPMVMKHWRQDWQYEPAKYLHYQGRSKWQSRPVTDNQGVWLQTVFQVDDAPRYAAIGKWQHQAGLSVWTSRTDNRPLPRREASVRKDYDMLTGTNKVTVLPYGWTHEQANDKVKLNKAGDTVAKNLAREIGLNRYLRIKDFDFSGGDSYWQKTGAYWADVRQVWQDHMDRNEKITLASKIKDKPRFADLFDYADKIEKGKVTYSQADALAYIKKAIEPFTKEAEANPTY